MPINLLVPIPGTPLQNAQAVEPLDFVRTIAVARIMLPKSVLRLSAGRRTMSEELQALCFFAGANSIFVGDRLLTTDNVEYDHDTALFGKLGLQGMPTGRYQRSERSRLAMTEIPRLVAEYSRNNEDLVDWTEQVFTGLCSNSSFQWLFFNTLSYMEHIGSYKIMATQCSDVLDYPTLKHLNEETGHAVFFKRHAERHKGAQPRLFSCISHCASLRKRLLRSAGSFNGPVFRPSGKLSHDLSLYVSDR